MTGLFSEDSIFIKLLNRVGDVIILSVIFFISCIPIITIGPSLTALYYTGMRGITGDDGYVAKNFFKSFKANFKQSIIIFLIFLAAFFVFGFDLWFWMYQMRNTGSTISKVLLVVNVVLLALTAMMFTFVFPLQAKFENKIKVQLRNAFLLSIKYFPTTMIVIIVSVLAACVIYSIPTTIALFILAGFGILGYGYSSLFYRCLKPYLNPSEGSQEDDELEEMSDEENNEDRKTDEDEETDTDEKIDEEHTAEEESEIDNEEVEE